MIVKRLLKATLGGIFIPILLLVLGSILVDSRVRLVESIGNFMFAAVDWPLSPFERLFPLPRDPSYPACCKRVPLDACCDPSFHLPSGPALLASVATNFIVYSALTYFLLWAFQKWNRSSPKLVELN
jgi:dolichyl-phosphate-mannose--protein O-mannosyl transferase